jgi:hypothetical protein
MTQQRRSRVIENDRVDFGPTQVDANPHHFTSTLLKETRPHTFWPLSYIPLFPTAPVDGNFEKGVRVRHGDVAEINAAARFDVPQDITLEARQRFAAQRERLFDGCAMSRRPMSKRRSWAADSSTAAF